MKKLAAKSATQPAVETADAVKPSRLRRHRSKPVNTGHKETKTNSKQARVLALLSGPTGTTIAAIMQTTGWQQHSVRGFLAGVVRKRLKLKLGSKKVDGNRVYQIANGDSGKSRPRQSKRNSR